MAISLSSTPSNIALTYENYESPVSPLDQALPKYVASLLAWCTATEDHFSAIEARIDDHIATQVATDSKLANFADTQQVVISAITTLIDQLDTIALSLDNF